MVRGGPRRAGLTHTPTLIAHPRQWSGTYARGWGHLAREGTGFLVPDGVERARPGRHAPGRVECPRGWCAVGRSGQGEPHLVPGHAAVVGGGQALVDEP